jgi:HEPN domain-containing protein
MGIRKIEDEIDLREAMKKKAAELKIKDIQAKAATENFTKEKLNELAKRHGVILALTPELKEEVKNLQKKYNIPSSKIITEQITENDVLIKFSKIDHEKLGMLAYQRVLMQKEEIGGGLLPLTEVFDLINTGILKGVVDIKDLLKALKILKKSHVIDELKELESGIIMVRFFPVEYTSDQVKVIGIAKEKGFISLEDVCVELNWSQDRALETLKSLEETGVAKFRESLLKGKQWFFPSI